MGKQVKLSLFAGGILYIRDPKIKSTRKLEIINIFRKVARYKIKSQKKSVGLCIATTNTLGKRSWKHSYSQ